VDSKDHTLMAASMRAGLNFAPPQKRYDDFMSRARPAFTALIESALLHDVITVPTEDYINLTAIVDVLGDRAAIRLMESGVLRFLRVRGALAYAGGGKGIVDVSFPFNGAKSANSAIGADVPDAIRWALNGTSLRKILPVYGL